MLPFALSRWKNVVILRSKTSIMKKYLLIIIAAVCLSSCTKDDEEDNKFAVDVDYTVMESGTAE